MKDKKILKGIITRLIILSGYGIVVFVLYLYNVPCFFKTVFSAPCPGCGMTRAVISALRLDFESAFKYHSMFWSLPFICAYMVVPGNIISKSADRTVLIIIGAGFLLNWILHFVL